MKFYIFKYFELSENSEHWLYVNLKIPSNIINSLAVITKSRNPVLSFRYNQ